MCSENEGWGMHFQGKAISNTTQLQGEVADAGQWQIKNSGAYVSKAQEGPATRLLMPVYSQGELLPNAIFCNFLKWSLSGSNSSNTFLHKTVKNVLKLIKTQGW